MARPKKVIEIEQKKGSLSLLEMVVAGIIVTVLGLIIWKYFIGWVCSV